MITRKLIQQEAKELKQALKIGEMVIPSFWPCCWPGLMYVGFTFILSGFSTHWKFNDFFLVAILSFIVFMVISGLRSHYLCIPRDFLKRSKLFSLLKNKVKIYLCAHLMMITFSSIFFHFYFPVDADKFMNPNFSVMLLLSIIISVAVFSIDIGRYQLSAFVAIIESFKNPQKKETPHEF